MKNEIIEFFTIHSENFEIVIENARAILSLNKASSDKNGFVLLNIVYDFLKDNKLEFLLSKVNEMINSEVYNLLSNFIKEEQVNIFDYFELIKLERENNYPKLVDFEWKFIGLSTMESFERGELVPKILLKLKFNNGKNKIVETDFANLKKLQEEIEENLSSFSSNYSRKIETFAK